ncbi:MAG TPA: MBL fold metallo-hydrolase [Pirellulales bacterium]|nr:MBL fold metallo-hydrolase [Pirellulales bacterium]
MVELAFHGAAETVTGSKYLLAAADARVLVDCGLFQGLKELRLRNWQPPLFDVASLDCVVLTHTHIDHVGYLPRLVKLGFQPPVWCTPATQDLADIILRDGRPQPGRGSRVRQPQGLQQAPAGVAFVRRTRCRSQPQAAASGRSRPVVQPGRPDLVPRMYERVPLE